MEKTAEPTAMFEKSISSDMLKASEEFVVPVAVAQPKPEANPINKILQVAAYPISALSGFWAAHWRVHGDTYNNLKRFDAFKDIHQEGVPGGLDMRNRKNVQDRILHPETHSVEKFLEISKLTKSEYSQKVSARMEQYGLGGGMTNFKRKWEYINSPAKLEATLVGLTVTGVALGAMLTVANGKSLFEIMSGNAEEEKTR